MNTKTQSIKDYILENYELEVIKDIATHGCSGGIGGLIYYTETVKFHDENEEEIWELLYNEGQGMSFSTTLAFIASLNGSQNVLDITRLKNLLVWYAVEHFARKIVEEKEENK